MTFVQLFGMYFHCNSGSVLLFLVQLCFSFFFFFALDFAKIDCQVCFSTFQKQYEGNTFN